MKKLLLAALCGLVANGCLAKEATINFVTEVEGVNFAVNVIPTNGEAEQVSVSKDQRAQVKLVDSTVKNIKLSESVSGGPQVSFQGNTYPLDAANLEAINDDLALNGKTTVYIVSKYHLEADVNDADIE